MTVDIKTDLTSSRYSRRVLTHWLKQENIETVDIHTDPDFLHPLLCATVSDPDAFVLSMKYPNIAQAIRDYYKHTLKSKPFWSDFMDEIDRSSEMPD